MKVLGLISSLNDPASRTRIIQYQDYFRESGNELKFPLFFPLKDEDPARWTYSLKKITSINEWRSWNIMKTIARFPLIITQYNYDLIWQSRLILHQHSFVEKLLQKPVIFDYDDAIWLTEGKTKVQQALKLSTMIFAGNDYLAEYASSYNKNIHIIPTTVDTNSLKPTGNKGNYFTLGWIGTKSNFQYLDLIKAPIIEFLSKTKNTRFMVVSSEQPSMFTFDNEKIIFRTWFSANENELVNEFSVGLMPLADDEWTRGKCSYKMLQYMACGKPVIASAVGMNKKIFSEEVVGVEANSQGDWLNGFHTLQHDIAFYQICSLNGRKLAEKSYSCNEWAPRILALFKTITRK
jgi:glycosyltransferase involved in cell wall biosynthesis